MNAIGFGFLLQAFGFALAPKEHRVDFLLAFRAAKEATFAGLNGRPSVSAHRLGARRIVVALFGDPADVAFEGVADVFYEVTHVFFPQRPAQAL